MYDGSRVTDAVDYWRRRDELKPAVRVLRGRSPERFRWRKAVANVSEAVGPLRGKDRALLEEPVREIVFDLGDHALQREVVLDARRVGVDLDRGEILLRRTLSDVQGYAREAGTDLARVGRRVRLPGDPLAPVDTAAVVVVGRALADYYRTKAQRILLSVPDPDGPEALRGHHRILLERADLDREESQRWLAFARLTLG